MPMKTLVSISVKLWMSETAVDVADGRKRHDGVTDVNSSALIMGTVGFFSFFFVAADFSPAAISLDGSRA